MGKGPKLHLKRLNTPKNWNLGKMGGIFATRPHPGSHKSRECLPLILLVSKFLKYANDAREAKMIIEKGQILINGKPRTCPKFPVGLMDVIFIPLLNKTLRLIYNASGRWTLVKQKFKEEDLEKPLLVDFIENKKDLKKVKENEDIEKKEQKKMKEKKEKEKEKKIKKEGFKVEKNLFTKVKETEKKKVENENVFKGMKKVTKEESNLIKKENKNEAKVKNDKKEKIKKKKEKGDESDNEISTKEQNGGRFQRKKIFYLPCRVRESKKGNKKLVGINRAATNPSEKAIPYLTTFCGRTLRYVDENIKPFDTVVLKIISTPVNGISEKKARHYVPRNVRTEIMEHYELTEGNLAIVMRGKNVGRVGRIKLVEKHMRMSDVIYLEDERGNKFVTKKENVMVIGKEMSFVGLGRDRGVRMSLEEKVKFKLGIQEKKINVSG